MLVRGCTGRIVECVDSWCGRGNQRSMRGYASTTGRGAKVWPHSYSWDDECGVYYVNHENGSEAEIGVISSGC